MTNGHHFTEREQRWRDLRFGMFIHFGLYSLLGGVWKDGLIPNGYSEQIQSHAGIPRDEYAALARQFDPARFDADAIAGLAVEAGMRYVVITAKHHDGFSLFHTRQSSFNVVDASPYGRDIVLELSEACRRHGLAFGVYFSWIDWHFPHAAPMSRHNSDPITPEHMAFNLAQVEELLTNYGPIAEVWLDMGAPTVEQSRQMAEHVHRLQPDAMINGRIWNDQGDFSVLGDNEVPTYRIAGPWQTPASIYKETWGYRAWQERTDLNGKIEECKANLREVLARGGNYLLNIGPRGDGSVVEFEAQVLRGIGRWIEKNGGLSACAARQNLSLSDAGGDTTVYRWTGSDYYSCKLVPCHQRNNDHS
ncbi:MAG: alpha-L-fucosidase [Candidatus Pacebacteria bacterium]|nr:alpha-L-fucosidase [Candidatus Paceibacterota bacterium]